MKLYSYVVRKDLGLAPNPFWGYCTVAVCTPNHVGIKAVKDDWIIGTSPVSLGSKLVYAMQISEVLSFEAYYANVRFKKKKPVVHGSWRERCGDNMYHKDQQGQWIQHRTIHHRSPEKKEQDLKHPAVFVAKYFYYFGNKAITIPAGYQDLVWKRQGCKGKHDPKVVENFLKWLKVKYASGVLGNPKDNDEAQKASCL
jgi:Nucleotide modification associated domain 2